MRGSQDIALAGQDHRIRGEEESRIAGWQERVMLLAEVAMAGSRTPPLLRLVGRTGLRRLLASLPTGGPEERIAPGRRRVVLAHPVRPAPAAARRIGQVDRADLAA